MTEHECNNAMIMSLSTRLDLLTPKERRNDSFLFLILFRLSVFSVLIRYMSNP